MRTEIWNDARSQVDSASKHVSGTLKITLPMTWGMEVLLPCLGNFSSKYPDIKFQIDMICQFYWNKNLHLKEKFHLLGYFF